MGIDTRTEKSNGPSTPCEKACCSLVVRSECVLDGTDEGADHGGLESGSGGITNSGFFFICGDASP